jgi:hypothetical protein
MGEVADVVETETLRRAILNLAKAVNATALVVRELKRRGEGVSAPPAIADALSSDELDQALESAARSLAQALDELEPRHGNRR